MESFFYNRYFSVSGIENKTVYFDLYFREYFKRIGL